MSYEEKSQWIYAIVNALAFTAYVAIIAGRVGATPLDELDYAPTLLLTIGAAIGLTIAGHIVVEILRPNASHVSDERDRDIDRFGEYVGGRLLGVGMIVPFVLALAERPTFWIANAIYAVFAVSAFVGTVVKLVAYRRGL